ncbi:hypothetical protein MoryE10_05080 [Methylogaea oryzae]|uniref:Uncharacterized protein n=1 Tax=Methylogaea oryzae TaxID=1295382 RepID=A0A8D4VMM4_9GAMM|nr:hypothetical protein MoryE10_05080 [Methylogaea oryzae]
MQRLICVIGETSGTGDTPVSRALCHGPDSPDRRTIAVAASPPPPEGRRRMARPAAKESRP